MRRGDGRKQEDLGLLAGPRATGDRGRAPLSGRTRPGLRSRGRAQWTSLEESEELAPRASPA